MRAALATLPALAALHWDPQIRGFLIVATAVLLLIGSIYLLLATNTGAKIGFVLAAAGLSGWIFMLALVWAMYGSNPTTGLQGGPQGWVLKEIVTGDLAAHSSTPVVVTAFPNSAEQRAGLASGQTINGWRQVLSGQPGGLADAQASADHYLTQKAAPKHFAGPFKSSGDYVIIGGYTRLSSNYLFRIGSYRVRWTIGWPTWWGAKRSHHELYIKHPPHYFVIQAQPSLPTVNLAGAAPSLPAADVTKPVTSVVMIRDVGSRRQPALMIAVAAFLIFAVCTSFLHRRDREIMRRKALAPATA